MPTDTTVCYRWPRECEHYDDLACMHTASMKDPEYRKAHRRQAVLSFVRQQTGRWLPRLCRHHAQVGPIDGPMTCMDCRKVLPDG